MATAAGLRTYPKAVCGQGSPLSPNTFGGECDIAGQVLPWLVGLVVVIVLLKGFLWVPATSKRKGIYDPYLRLAERERMGDPD